jgi:allantoate deiminase
MSLSRFYPAAHAIGTKVFWFFFSEKNFFLSKPGISQNQETHCMDIVSIPADAAEIMARLDALALCTDQPGEITRLFLSPAHKQAAALVLGWMQQAGLTARLDASGTVVGVRQGAAPGAPRLLIGSHIDTVRRAGRYDGCLGVVLGIALAARLRNAPLPYTLEIRAFGDEEGVRFPVTLTGAKAAAGAFDPAWLDVQDAEGISLGQALRAFGLEPGRLLEGECTAQGAFAYLEVHIEQGPVLERLGAPLGVVTAINGAARFEIEVTGQAGHAGTVPMDQRRDALVAAAAMVLAVDRVAHAHPGVVATVGRLAVSPGATNVIPGSCTFSIDLRADQDPLRNRAEAEMTTELQAIAASYGTGISVRCTHSAPATACDHRLQALLARAIGSPAPSLPSGAGHDAMAVAGLCPVGMLFVRCAGGISHHPDEAVSEADVALALDAMTVALRSLNPSDYAGWAG